MDKSGVRTSINVNVTIAASEEDTSVKYMKNRMGNGYYFILVAVCGSFNVHS